MERWGWPEEMLIALRVVDGFFLNIVDIKCVLNSDKLWLKCELSIAVGFGVLYFWSRLREDTFRPRSTLFLLNLLTSTSIDNF